METNILLQLNISVMKVMVKGKTLGDSWDGFPITNNATILMMGSKEENIPTGPSEKVKFMEDMNDAEIANAVKAISTAGFVCKV